MNSRRKSGSAALHLAAAAAILLLGIMIGKPMRALAAEHPVDVRLVLLDANGYVTEICDEYEDGDPCVMGTGGELTVSTTSAPIGTSVQAQAQAWPGYRLRRLTWGDPFSMSVGSYYVSAAGRKDILNSGSFTMPDRSVLIEAVYQRVLPGEARKISVVVSSFDENGIYTEERGGSAYADKEEALPGESVLVTVKPVTGFVLDSITWGTGLGDGADITDTGSFIMWNNLSDVVVDVCFQKKFEPVNLSGATVTGITDKVWNGKKQTPDPVVRADGKRLTEGTDYTLRYANNLNVGKATVYITGKGNYTGKRIRTFKINPSGTKITGVTGGVKKLQVKWRKQGAKMSASRITGYQLQISTVRTFSRKKTETVKGYSKVSKTIRNLGSKRRYFVRIRTYKTVNNVKYWSAWSPVAAAKTK